MNKGIQVELGRRIKHKIYRCLVPIRLNRLTFGFNYLVNIWENNESRSGEGSSLEYTENIRKELPILIERMDFKSVLDIPCGDFFWMNKILKENKLRINYTGVDIVGRLIRDNKRKYAKKGIHFERRNAIKYEYPPYDLVIARDFIFHLSFTGMRQFLKNFIDSGSAFLLTSSYLNVEDNSDILNGEFRHINLFKHPYFFATSEIKIKDFVYPYPERYLFLFTREEVCLAVHRQNQEGDQN